MAPRPTKNNLSIRLTESVVFLRGAIESTVTGRRSQREAQPAMLRGLLTLELVKPTKISSIEIVLEGKSTTAWPEGVGARRLEVTEDHEIFSTKTVFFLAGKEAFGAHARRTASVGPGLILERDEDEDEIQSTGGFRGRAGPSGVHGNHTSDERLHQFSTSNSAVNGTPSRRPYGEVDLELEPHPERYSLSQRRMSMDQEFLQRGRSTYAPISSVSSSPNDLAASSGMTGNGNDTSFLDDLPSPPYSPRVAPVSASSSSTTKTEEQARAIDIPGRSHHRSYSTSHVVASSSPTMTIVSPQQAQDQTLTSESTQEQEHARFLSQLTNQNQNQNQTQSHSLSHRAPGTRESWMSCSIASESTIFEEGEGPPQSQQRSEDKIEAEGSSAGATEGNSDRVGGDLDASDNIRAGSGNGDGIDAAPVTGDQQTTNHRPALHTSDSHNTISTVESDDSGSREGQSSGSGSSDLSVGSQNSNPDLSPLSLSRHTSSDGHQIITSTSARDPNAVVLSGQVVAAPHPVVQVPSVSEKPVTQVQSSPSQNQIVNQQHHGQSQTQTQVTYSEEIRNQTISPSRGRTRFPPIDTSIASTSAISQSSNNSGISNSSVAGSIAASISQLFGHHGRSSRSSTPTRTPPASHTPSRTPSRAPSRTPSRVRLSTLTTQASQPSQVTLPPSVPVSPAASTTFHTPPPSAVFSSTQNVGVLTESGSNLSSPTHLTHPNSFTATSQQQQGSPSATGKMRQRDESRGAASDRGRRYGRFSLAMVSTALFDTVKERLRSSSPNAHGGVSRERLGRRDSSPDRRRDVSEDRGTERGRSRAARARVGVDDEHVVRGGEHVDVKEHHKEKSTLERLGEVLGLDGDDGGSGDGWKEFRKGTYTYPISFAIPANSPPTLQCDFGSVAYRLKATVHRPGAFTTRLTATRDVTLIACPGEDDLDESDNIVVQREWDSQMHYLIVVSGRAFPIGSSIPLQITFMPIAKIKVYRISAYIEERVDYYTQFKRVARSDSTKKFELLSIRYPEKDPPALLPLTSDFSYSPLRGYVDAADDSEAASEIMGPGPWTIQAQLQLPKSCARMHFTNKHKKSNIGINHTLKIVMRVERGDDHYLDSKTGRRKNFDIVVQTPIHILSCRCNPEWTSLPRYSSFATETHSKTQTCPCTSKRPGSTVTVDEVDPAMDLALHNPLGASNVAGPSRPTRTRVAANDSHYTTYPLPPPLEDGTNGHRAFLSGPSVNGSSGDGGFYLDGVNLTLSRQNSLTPSETDSVFRRGSLFARLVAGEESEQGEAPPRYDCIAETRHFMSAGASAEVVPAPHR